MTPIERARHWYLLREVRVAEQRIRQALDGALLTKYSRAAIRLQLARQFLREEFGETDTVVK